jgi:hypothetical protein
MDPVTLIVTAGTEGHRVGGGQGCLWGAEGSGEEAACGPP